MSREEAPFEIKYRPTDFDEIMGNKETVQAIKDKLGQPNCPHTFLFCGPRGTGKTTLARIIRKKLGCGDMDFVELNAANTRGIDTVREIYNTSGFAPSSGKCRVYLLDECFIAGSPVNTAQGFTPIEKIKVGEEVFNLVGKGFVEKVFKNEIPFERIVRITFSDGAQIICSKDHLFLTDSKWVEAVNLTKKDLLFNFLCDLMQDIKSQGDENNGRETMQILREDVSSKEKKSEVLFPKLCGEMEKCSTGVEREGIHSGKEQSCFGRQKQIEDRKPFSLGEPETTKLRENEENQPHAQRRKCRKNDVHKKDESDFEHLLRNSGWEWHIHYSSENSCISTGLGNGSGDSYQPETNRIPNLLQSGCGKPEIENCNRSRRSFTPMEEEYIKRQKERGEAGRIRVESIEILQRRSDGEFATGNFQDSQINKEGRVIFYDLQISNHPSYFVNNLLVHNCHQITSAAQEALLKITEDVPKHVYFLFSTTNPEKLIAPLRSRCTTYRLELITRREIIKLLTWVLVEEKYPQDDIDYFNDVIFKIAKVADGCPREALILLNQSVTLSKNQALEMISKHVMSGESQVIQLCQQLLGPDDWSTVAKTLSQLDGDSEQLRRGVMTYASKVLMSGKYDVKAIQMLRAFATPTYDTGKPGLVLAAALVKLK